MRKILLIPFLIACLIGLAGNLMAAPAVPWLVEKRQPDGSIISVYLRGDEKMNWMESPDGYTLLNNDQGFVVYAGLDQAGNLIPSETIYEPSALRSSSEKADPPFPKGLHYSPSQKDDFLKRWETPQLRSSTLTSTSVLGEKKALCILVGFRDRAFVKTKSEINNLMNQIGYRQGTAVGSVRDFYRENSCGKMDLVVSPVGPYTLSQRASYYSSIDYWQEFAKEALLLADQDVDFREFANEAGQLETVHILFAGYGDESVNDGGQIWSHKWGLDEPLILDEVECSVYSCSPELRGSNGQYLTAIGPICHETCHVFGASDYYDTENEGSANERMGTGTWDLMAKGCWNRNGDVPAHINVFEKIRFGWVNAFELTEPTTVSGLPNSALYPFAYIIKPYTNNEQYILENRQRTNFNNYIPGSGLLIYHIHDQSVSSGKVSNTDHPQQAYLVSASSSCKLPDESQTSYGATNSAGTAFSRNGAIASFTKETTPAMFRWKDDTIASIEGVLDKPLTQIKQTNGLISFDFMLEGDNLPCYPVRNPEFFILGSDSLLVWERPLGDKIDYTYEVYRNDEQIGLNSPNTRLVLTGHTQEMSRYQIKAKSAEADSCSFYLYSENPSFYYMIDSLAVEQFKQDVLLSWDLPEKEHPYDSLYIYRDNERIVSLLDTVDFYCDSLVAPGDHQYSIITDYGNNKYSPPIKESISVSLYVPCGEIDSLQFAVELDTVRLSWLAVEDVEAYHVYRDSVLIGEGITDLFYRDTIPFPIDSTYTYLVEVADELCLIPGTSIEVDYLFPYLPAKELLLDQFKQDVLLSWSLQETEALVDSLYLFRGDSLLMILPDTADFYCDSLVLPGEYEYSLVVDYGNDKLSTPLADSISVSLYVPCGEIDSLQFEVELDTVRLSWLAVEDVEAYNLYRDSVLIGEGITDLFYRDTIPFPLDSTYTYLVEVADTLCLIPGTSIEVDYLFPYLPAKELLLDQFKQDVLLSWSLQETEALVDSLYLFRGDSLLMILPDTADFYCDSLVLPGGYEYSLVVDYGNDKLSTPLADSISVTLYVPCGEIDSLQFEVELDTVRLSWLAVEDVEAYHIYRDSVLIGEGITDLFYQDTIPFPLDSTYTYLVEVADTLCLIPGTSIEVDYLYPYLPVDSLMAQQAKQNVVLDWELPQTEAIVDSLYLYRDNRLLLALPDTARHYTDSLVKAGDYLYSLVVDYGRDKLSEEASVAIQVETYIPPVHLEILDGEIRVVPTITEAWVTISVPESARLQVKSLAGLLLEEHMITGSQEIRLDYPPGLYLLMVDTGKTRSTYKIILR